MRLAFSRTTSKLSAATASAAALAAGAVVAVAAAHAGSAVVAAAAALAAGAVVAVAAALAAGAAAGDGASEPPRHALRQRCCHVAVQAHPLHCPAADACDSGPRHNQP